VLVDSGLEEYLAQHGDAAHLFVASPRNGASAIAALTAAANILRDLPHPDEPTEPLTQYVAVDAQADPPVLSFDIKDLGPDVAHVIVMQLAEEMARVDAQGTLSFVAPIAAVPKQVFERDVAAVWPGLDDAPLDELDSRGLPPAFPTRFPIPTSATLVLATRAPTGSEQAVWRRADGDIDFADLFEALPEAGFRLKRPKASYRIVWAWQERPTPTFPPGSTVKAIERPDGVGTVWAYRRARRGRELGYFAVRWRPTVAT
jgi:hypothetical protein